MSDTKKMNDLAIGGASQVGADERRRHDRFDAAFDVSVSMTNDSGRRVGAEAWVRDVSASGLGLSCIEPFAVGDVITVRAPGRSLQCEVRHCRQEGEMFTLGLELLSSSDATDIQGSLRELGRSLHFESRTKSEDAKT
jgi:hypothetical protein